MATPKVLTKKQLTKALKTLSVFEPNGPGNKLVGTFKFANHVDALVFIAKLTVHAQVADHHPDINFTYSKVKVSLSTHSVKGITKKDVALATKAEKLFAAGGG